MPPLGQTARSGEDAMRNLTMAAMAMALLGTGCGGMDAEVPDEEALNRLEESGKADSAAMANYTFYVVTRPDLRRCMFPLCGGFYVKRVNRSTTRCADGTYAAECRVGDVDYSALRLDENELSDFSNLFEQHHA